MKSKRSIIVGIAIAIFLAWWMLCISSCSPTKSAYTDIRKQYYINNLWTYRKEMLPGGDTIVCDKNRVYVISYLYKDTTTLFKRK